MFLHNLFYCDIMKPYSEDYGIEIGTNECTTFPMKLKHSITTSFIAGIERGYSEDYELQIALRNTQLFLYH